VNVEVGLLIHKSTHGQTQSQTCQYCCDIRSILFQYSCLDVNIETGMPPKTKEGMTYVRWVNGSVV
jgi:hypothetical protein